jgi:formylglycine-generating enzyme required for sulfatase activity/serine/threonine protein kinase
VSDQSNPADPKDLRVEAALRNYLERIDRGEPIDREKFLAGHAPIADELRSFIAAEDELRKLAGPETPLDRAHDSTQSFVGHGQETLVPQSVDKLTGQTGEPGLTGQFGRYRIVRALGRGAMGAVYLAEDTQLERSVAIKTPHFTESLTEESLERFYREARVAATLRHTNICPVFDVGQIDGKHYISMAYIEGRSLSAFIQPDKPQTERQILIVIRKLALALQEAHDHSIVHRDLKPANVMVDKKGEPIIMDFGLAQQVRRNEDVRLTQTGNILGTPAYMSPEQVEGEPGKIGPSTDQYSLGVILYELLTAQLPFRGSVVAVMGQILTKEVPPPSQSRTALDPRIDGVCLKMMAKTPSERFASLKSVADEIAIILKSPAAKATAQDKPVSPTALLAAGDPPRAEASASQVLKSLKTKAVTESDLASLEELARKCLGHRDYDQVILIAERIPEEKRNAAMQTLLERARARADEIAFLLCDIDEAVRLEQFQTAFKKAEALLKIKPGHHRALEIQQQFGGEGDGGVVRLGPKEITQTWSEGGWVPWSALAFGLAIVGVVWGLIIIWLGKTAIVIDAKDPGITVEVKGLEAFITVPGKQSIKVQPGNQEITVSYGGLETQTRKFVLKKGQTQILTVAIVNSQLVAQLANEIAPLTSGHDEKSSSPTASGNGPLLSQTPAQVGNEVDKVAPTQKKPADVVPSAPAVEANIGHSSRKVTAGESAAKSAQQNLAERLKTPVISTNSLGIKLALIPPGEFPMGSPESERERAGNERQHRVRITKPFYLGVYEINQSEFERVMGRNPSYFFNTGRQSEAATGVDTSRNPVEQVTWYDAVEFCNKLSEKEGRRPYYRIGGINRHAEGWITDAKVSIGGGSGYCLPTEAQWEYACRAGTTTPFDFGTADNGAESNCNGRAPYGTSVQGPALSRTLPVGGYRPNAFGLYDMHGNVWEWCWDMYDAAYYKDTPASDPAGPSEGPDRVMRGGAWCALALECRAAHRGWNLPGHRYNDRGFRVARVPVDKEVVEIAPEEKKPADVVPGLPNVGPQSNVASTASKVFGRPFFVRGEWTIENDELVQPTLAAGDDFHPLLVFGEESLSNYDLTWEAKKTGGRHALGIQFHWLGPGHYREFSLIDNGHIDLSYRYNGKWGREESNSKGLSYSSNRWYSLKVEARGDTFRAYLDGVLQFEQTDARFAHGRICLFTLDTAARFRRIKVSDPQGKVLFEGLPELPPTRNNTTPKANVGHSSRLLTTGETAAKSAQNQLAARLKTPVISTNSLGTKLALIPPGEFSMGSPESESRRGGYEQQHRVRITKPFYLGVYEITQSEFEQVMGRNPSDFLNKGGQSEVSTGVDTSRYPVDSVSWYEAIEFCNKLSKKEGRQPYYRLADIEREDSGSIKEAKVSVAGGGGYRLPTEAQWEYACRAGTTTPFNIGAANNGAESNCNGLVPCGTDVQGPSLGRPVPVGSYRPNAFGLYDMHGNVWEWCWDVFGEYQKNPQESDPAGPSSRAPKKVVGKKSKPKNSLESDPEGPSGGSHRDRVNRGGCFSQTASHSRSAGRGWSSPGWRSFALGFRVARGSGE